VAFVRSNPDGDEEGSRHSELVVGSLADGSETVVTSDQISIDGIPWSPDGSSLAYTAGAKVIQHDQAPSYSGAKIIYRTSEYTELRRLLQYLLQQGYVVFAPDYRGSIGYGRDWRNGVYMDAGGKDAKDAWMSANYLKTLSYVDSDRIGIWGLSYGGFFTLIAMTDQPTLFKAGVDVAG